LGERQPPPSDYYSKGHTILGRPGPSLHRLFVALYDDPPLMSPNPDAVDEKLPFREEKIMKVWREDIFSIKYKK